MRNFILGAVAAFIVMLLAGTTPQQVLANAEAWVKTTWQQQRQ